MNKKYIWEYKEAIIIVAVVYITIGIYIGVLI